MQFSSTKHKFFPSITKRSSSSSSSSSTLESSIQHRNRESEQQILLLFPLCNTFLKLTQLHTLILKLGFHKNPLILTKFTSTSSNLSSIDYATSFVFSSQNKPHNYDTFLFNTVIRGYAQPKQSTTNCRNGIRVYNLMLSYGVLPNKFTYPFVLKACSSIKVLHLGESLHGSVFKFGFDLDNHVQNTLIHMYGCCDDEGIRLARMVFDEMTNKNSVSWSAMIGGYVRLRRSVDAIELFKQMQSFRVAPDEITMISVLSACTELSELELGKWVESYIENTRMEKCIELSNALIDMYAKCGDVDKALCLFRKMKERTIVSWTSVIIGMSMHGRGLAAIALFEEMKGEGFVPDSVAFIGVLSACSHSGLVNQGRQYLKSMIEEYAIVPGIAHYGCMVDLLCRAGLVEEALEFVREMPIKPNSVIWRTLINGCRDNGKIELGEHISKELIKEEPMEESNYVMLSNIYATKLCWDKKNKIRHEMDMKGIRKVAGSTMV